MAKVNRHGFIIEEEEEPVDFLQEVIKESKKEVSALRLKLRAQEAILEKLSECITVRHEANYGRRIE